VFRVLYAIVLGLLGGVIIHICVLLLISHYTRKSIWFQILQSSPPYRLQTLDLENPIMKTSDSLFRLATCYFHLTDEPVHITARGHVPFWSLSLYNAMGINVYSINNYTAPNGVLDMVVSAPIQATVFKKSIHMDTVLTVQNTENAFLILRVFRPSSDWDKRVAAFFASVNCKRIND